MMASDDLGLTQPAVSRSVKELEQILGTTLFDRSARGARLTVKGKLFLEHAEAALLQLNQGVSVLGGSGRDGEQITIGALPNVCSQFLPGVIKTFKEAFPNVVVTILPGSNAALLEMLKRADADVVIGRLSNAEDMRGLSFEALFEEPLVFVVRAGHELTKGPVSPDDLAAYTLILPPTGTIIREELDRFFFSSGIALPSNRLESTSSEFQRAYLKENNCVAAIPRGVLQTDLEDGTFVELDLGDKSLKGPVGLTTNPKVIPSPILTELMRLIRIH